MGPRFANILLILLYNLCLVRFVLCFLNLMHINSTSVTFTPTLTSPTSVHLSSLCCFPRHAQYYCIPLKTIRCVVTHEIFILKYVHSNRIFVLNASPMCYVLHIHRIPFCFIFSSIFICSCVCVCMSILHSFSFSLSPDSSSVRWNAVHNMPIGNDTRSIQAAVPRFAGTILTLGIRLGHWCNGLQLNWNVNYILCGWRVLTVNI